MPTCRDCKWRKDKECTAPLRVALGKNGRQPTPVRHCIGAIIDSMVEQASGKLVEIGPGNAQMFKALIDRKRRDGTDVQWYGVDPKFIHARDGFYPGSAAHIPFDDNYFDMACSICSIEHWQGYGESVADGIAEIRRVLKPGGIIWLVIPIHYHGEEIFVRGYMRGIKRPFKTGWKDVRFEPWRKDYEPLEPFRPWKTARGRRRSRVITRMVMESSRQKIPSSWMLEVTAAKD